MQSRLYCTKILRTLRTLRIYKISHERLRHNVMMATQGSSYHLISLKQNMEDGIYFKYFKYENVHKLF